MKECNSCGKCCIKYSNGALYASPDEIEYWQIFRPNIAEYSNNNKIWMDPKTAEQLTLCPWLKKVEGTNKIQYHCEIYFDRPDDCKHYPTTVTEMINDDCEMIAVNFIVHSHQHAQYSHSSFPVIIHSHYSQSSFHHSHVIIHIFAVILHSHHSQASFTG